MIRGYSISEEDIDRVMPFVRGVIHELEVSISMYYCGYTGEISLGICEEEC
jgi:hypothetical protein